jgi:inhibitor of cysteine peptidase
MKKWIIGSLITFVLVSLLLSGCNPSVKAYNEPSNTINTSVNQEFTIALGSNITTGYSWQPTYDTNAFTLVGKEYKPDDTTGKIIVGAPGTEYFHFKAIKIGSSQIAFTYYRPWETPKSEDKTAKFNIIVK